MKIGELSRATGVDVETVCYYVQHELAAAHGEACACHGEGQAR